MNWEPAIVTDRAGTKTASPWYILSDCRRYSVAKVIVVNEVWY
jgi:hypothetical protein